MALPTASDNVFPKIILSAETEPATPDAGEAKVFLDTSDSLLKWKDDGGTVYPIGTAPANIEDYSTAETDDTLVLAPDGAGGVEFRAEAGGGGGGALVLLEQHTASSSATLDFTTAISATYDDYQIEFINIQPATDSVVFNLQYSTDGGSNYDAGTNYDWADAYLYVTTGGADGAAGATVISIAASQVKNVTMGLNGSAKLYAPGGSIYKAATWDIIHWHNSLAAPIQRKGWGVYKSNTAVNAFRFLFSSGNIASGTIRVYGIAKS